MQYPRGKPMGSIIAFVRHPDDATATFRRSRADSKGRRPRGDTRRDRPRPHGLATLTSGAHLALEAAADLAPISRVSETAVRLTPVAVGASLPELATGTSVSLPRRAETSSIRSRSRVRGERRWTTAPPIARRDERRSELVGHLSSDCVRPPRANGGALRSSREGQALGK